MTYTGLILADSSDPIVDIYRLVSSYLIMSFDRLKEK